MKIKIKPNHLKDEKGITLIALIIMLIVLITLSTVVIKGVISDKIVDTSLSAVDEYTVKSYQEQVDEAARSIILKNTAGGRDTSSAGIAKDMNEVETLWVKNAEAVNEYLIVTVENGYAYEVYYDPIYGVVFTEYIGRDDGKGFPSLSTKYEKSEAKITGTVSAENGNTVEKVELIYKGEVKQNKDKASGNIEFDVEEIETGWYIIKATSSSGKTIYNWIRVRTTSEKLSAPKIAITPTKPESGWYNKASGTVTATITANSEEARGIKYWVSTDLASNPSEDGITVDSRTAEVTISGDGKKRIIAVEIDDKESESEGRASELVNIDTALPTIEVTQKIKDTETKAENPTSGWYNKDIEVTVDVKDEGSGENGYEYMVKNGEMQTIAGESWIKKSKETKIIFGTEGKNEILIRGLDIAGNTSTEETVTIQLDKTAPNFTQDPTITGITTNSFKVESQASDDLSGSAENQGKITYKCTVMNKSTNAQVGQSQTNETGIFEITELNSKIPYEVKIEVTDPAGNTNSKTTTTTTEGELQKPIITITPENENEKITVQKQRAQEEWYKGKVIITIADSVEEGITGATGIKYTITKTSDNKEIASGTPNEREITLDFTSAEGDIKITANMIGSNGDGPTEVITFKRDVTAPNMPSIDVIEQTINTIKVTAKSSDAVSGIASYKFEYSTSLDGPWNEPTNSDKGVKIVSNQNTCDYTYEGLEPGATYFFKVTVTDNIGLSSSNYGIVSGETLPMEGIDEP